MLRAPDMPPGVLLIHGFTATPECMLPLVEPLKKAGFLVEAPLLAGHGTTARELSQVHWQDWYEGVAEAFRSLQKKTDRVCVAGLSLGGILSLLLATEYPVDRLALLATPVIFKSFMANKVLPFVGNSFLKEIYRYQPKWAGPDLADPEAKKIFKSYTKMPIKGIMELVKLQEVVREKLRGIKAPTLIVHSPRDNTAPYENVPYLQEHLGSKQIRVVTLKTSHHIITLDYEKEWVAEEVASFFGSEL